MTDCPTKSEGSSTARRKAVRSYPIPPQLVELLRSHIQRFGTTPEGRLFRAVRGGPVRSQEYGSVWQEARRKALSAEQVTSPLARIPYDLRHACVSFWLRSGVSAAEAARRAGQSIAVLQRYYAKVLDGDEARMNILIERGFAERGIGGNTAESWSLTGRPSLIWDGHPRHAAPMRTCLVS